MESKLYNLNILIYYSLKKTQNNIINDKKILNITYNYK